MERTTFRSGGLEGWVAGEGLPVLLLHGGPGLSYEYLDGLAAELAGGYRVAAFQQRGVAPSTLDGPFDIPTAVADVMRVLDALAWERAWVVGHSWGGHLLTHVLASAPERVLGGLAVDPFGATGDGGTERFEQALVARTPEADRQRAAELDEHAMRGEATAEEMLESLRLVWRAYFASPERVIPFPADLRVSVQAYGALLAAAIEALPALERSLPAIDVPFGVVSGAASPMPAPEATVAAIQGAWLEVVAGAGHFVWFEQPGSVRAGLQRLTGRANPTR
jgi:pimeloyl-ACP methyl ester carboxylesterase